MTAACSVRLARPEDVPAISRLVEELDELHRAAHAHLFNPRAARDESQTLAALRDSASALLVAERGVEGQPTLVGFLRIRDVTTPGSGALAPRRFGLIDELMVDRARRREGVARELLSAAEGWARGRGLTAVEVTVWDFNLDAQEFYGRSGFEGLRRYLRKAL